MYTIMNCEQLFFLENTKNNLVNQLDICLQIATHTRREFIKNYEELENKYKQLYFSNKQFENEVMKLNIQLNEMIQKYNRENKTSEQEQNKEMIQRMVIDNQNLRSLIDTQKKTILELNRQLYNNNPKTHYKPKRELTNNMVNSIKTGKYSDLIVETKYIYGVNNIVKFNIFKKLYNSGILNDSIIEDLQGEDDKINQIVTNNIEGSIEFFTIFNRDKLNELLDDNENTYKFNIKLKK